MAQYKSKIAKLKTRKRYFLEKERRQRAAAAAVQWILLDEDDEGQKRKRQWMKPWLSRHDEQGAYPNLVRELEDTDLVSYTNYFRMGPEQFSELLEKVEPFISKQDTNFRRAVSAGERLAVTLRFLATGESYKSLGYSFRLGSTTIGKIVRATCAAIYNVLKDDYMKMPQSQEDWLAISKRFMERWNFPNTLGALDGKHIAVRAPLNSGSQYYNYKNFFSIVLLGLVDADYKFIYVDVGCNGRISDGGVFAGCSLAEALNRRMANKPEPTPLPGGESPVSYHIIGDDAFPLRDYLMKPFPFRKMNKEQRIYNYRLSRARRVVENAFGILSCRFRVFLNRMFLEPNVVEHIVLCACALHNFLIVKNDGHYLSQGLVDQESTTHDVTPGTWRNDTQLQSRGIPHSNNSGQQPKSKRDVLMEFCMSPAGAVDWQESKI